MRKVKASAVVIESIESDLKKILMKMYEEYKGQDTNEMAEQTSLYDFEMEADDLDGLDEVSKEIARERVAEQSNCIRNEVDQYLSDRYVSIFSKSFEIAKWWKGNEATYPVLSKLAKDIFAIPCSTVASENAFSLGERVVDPFRASLTPRMVEALVCTSDWLRADTPSLYKDPTEEDLKFYYELEELEKGNGVSN